MGTNFKFGYNFVAYTASASTADTEFPVTNLYDYEHALRQWRSTVITASWVKAYTGSSAITLKGIMLNDVNFTDILVQINTTDSWPGTSVGYTVTMDQRTGRYKIYIAFDSVSVKYIRIYINAQTPTDGLSYFRIGTFIVLNSVFEFTDNPTFPYVCTADEKMITNDFESGGYEDVNLGPLIWEGNFGFEVHQRTLESEVNIFGRMYKSANLVFFENYTDSALCYICRRRTPLQISWDKPTVNSIQTMTFREIY
jgi:hypothetical protein